MLKKEECSGIFVFVEIQDHERVLEGALEMMTRARQLADELNEKLYALVLALDAEEYLDEIEEYGPDVVLYCSDPALKHYNNEIFPEMFEELITEYRPSILLVPSTEAGNDLAPRMSHRFHTGITAHCTSLEIIDSEEYGKNLLLMKRPAFSGNMVASILCPETRPQIATVQPGVLNREPTGKKAQCERISLDFSCDTEKLRISQQAAPVRWDRCSVSLEQADVIIAGGRGLIQKENFDLLHDLAAMLGGEVGATRVPVFNNWCDEGRMIGQTGKTVRPRLYMSFGISGQIQHTTSIVDSEIIVSINIDERAPVNEISDYVIHEDAAAFLKVFIEKLREERVTFACR